MNERALAETLLRDHVLASRALAALQLHQLPDAVRARGTRGRSIREWICGTAHAD
jgi:hypothetical protein